jgi:hypothetical protein
VNKVADRNITETASDLVAEFFRLMGSPADEAWRLQGFQENIQLLSEDFARQLVALDIFKQMEKQTIEEIAGDLSGLVPNDLKDEARDAALTFLRFKLKTPTGGQAQ